MNVTSQYLLPPEDDSVLAFLRQRRRLFGVAYRILGRVADAEDVVQETWIRWQCCDQASVRDPAAFLATTAARLSINVLNSARSRYETCVGSWLPEPIDTSEDLTAGAERAEAIELATLLLMERLTATERAAYVLREAFAYPYRRIAEVIRVTEATARQLVSRARRHLGSEALQLVDKESQRRFLRVFLAAARGGDACALEQLLAGDAARVARRAAGSRRMQSVV